MEDDTVVIVTTSNPDRVEGLFDSVIVAAVAETPWAQERRIAVLVCRGPTRPIDEIWEEVKILI